MICLSDEYPHVATLRVIPSRLRPDSSCRLFVDSSRGPTHVILGLNLEKLVGTMGREVTAVRFPRPFSISDELPECLFLFDSAFAFHMDVKENRPRMRDLALARWLNPLTAVEIIGRSHIHISLQVAVLKRHWIEMPGDPVGRHLIDEPRVITRTA